ncbi:protein tantalus isoform X2 [Solenopsis invicta]|uniref:protein tantalus isoform X2 n=1 Tax=Solenopsis invicta TaxID=13686 RepID=UPI000595AAFE|nr:protein tantalus isoform X2 [Solenopsis invicta]XP_039312136.1 protein tantalus isoform X2 [Solenopsis invicta]
MDEKQTENSIGNSSISNVPMITANLEMLTIETNSLPTETKRILRKRISKPSDVRIVRLRSKKRKISEVEPSEDDTKDIKKYYLDKKINKKSNNLETIYEERDNLSDDAATCMSAKRFKRMLQFSPTASKLKKRREKIQRVFGSKIRYKKCSMQALVDKLNTIRESSPMKLDNELES